MALYLKRLVSGNKTRFRDDDLDIELDLAYVTDRIIVMGFPAVGVESIYRNRRTDVQRFLSARHRSDFWVFNFCPARENSYDASVFDRRVSRYPFPDHHVPPFMYLPLVTQEMHAWLSGSDTRVAVLHCKAGKGRSGTLACAYLLSLYSGSTISAPLHDSSTEWSLIDDKEGPQTPSADASATSHSAALPYGADLSRISSEPVRSTLEKVLDLHTSRRMKHALGPLRHKRPKMGVSIPSQRRWLSYWSQILAGNGPPSLHPRFLSRPRDTLSNGTSRSPKVSLTKLTVRMREPSRVQPHLVQAASVVMASAGMGRTVSQSATGKLWASLSRYSDKLVNELERSETTYHNPANAALPNLFSTDQWDSVKMIRSFAQMSMSDVHPDEIYKPILTYVLRPLDETQDWVKLPQPTPEPSHENSQRNVSEPASSHEFVSLTGEEEDSEDPLGVLLDANREVRIKLFMGEVALGWVWLIPAFHMSSDSTSSSLALPNDDIDFAIGLGKALVEIQISFAWHNT